MAKAKVRLIEALMNILPIPLGWNTVCAVAENEDFTVGLPKLFNDTYYLMDRLEDLEMNKAYLKGNAFVLVVKKSVYDRVDIEDLMKGLEDLAKVCAEEGVTRLAMPKICCGRNGLAWKDVKRMIKQAFSALNIQIVICK